MTRMTANRRFLYWGVLLIALGSVVVAADLGLVAESTIRDALGLWPLIPIALGVAIVVRRTPYSPGAWLVAAALPGLAIGGLFAAGPRLAIDCLGEGAALKGRAIRGIGERHVRAGCGTARSRPAGSVAFEAGDAPRRRRGLATTSHRYRQRGHWDRDFNGPDLGADPADLGHRRAGPDDERR
jgi:hypothetical protein